MALLTASSLKSSVASFLTKKNENDWICNTSYGNTQYATEQCQGSPESSLVQEIPDAGTAYGLIFKPLSPSSRVELRGIGTAEQDVLGIYEMQTICLLSLQ